MPQRKKRLSLLVGLPSVSCLCCTTDLRVGDEEIAAMAGGSSSAPIAASGGAGATLSGGSNGGASACDSFQEDTAGNTPVDIIFVIDNSSSMADKIEQIQERINDDFASSMEGSGLDFRVILISRYGDTSSSVGGSDNPICIRAPLGADDCSDPINTPLSNNPPHFFHYSADIESRTAWCQLLAGWSAPDELASDQREWTPLAPGGWSELVRAEAFKSIIVITDDRIECGFEDAWFDDGEDPWSAAGDFDVTLRSLSPEQFGTAEARRYKFYSIVGMAENDPPTAPWQPGDPLITDTCGNAIRPGTGYQALSIITGALRYPTCQYNNFNAIFESVAQGVIATAPCLR